MRAAHGQVGDVGLEAGYLDHLGPPRRLVLVEVIRRPDEPRDDLAHGGGLGIGPTMSARRAGS